MDNKAQISKKTWDFDGIRRQALRVLGEFVDVHFAALADLHLWHLRRCWGERGGRSISQVAKAS